MDPLNATQHHRQKSSMSWLDIKVWLQEVAEKMLGSFIDDVYILNGIFIFKLKNVKHSEEFLLIVEPGRRISVSKLKIKLKEEFVKSSSVWKGILKNCSIENIGQYDYERIIFVDLKCREESRRMIIELLPRGVIAILNNDNIILLASSYRKMKDRNIMPKAKYELPPKAKILDYYNLEVGGLRDLLSSEFNIVPSLIRGLDIPPEIADSINLLCKLDNKRVTELNEIEYRCIVDKLKELLTAIIEKPTPCIVYKNNSMVGFYPFIPTRFYGEGYHIEHAPSFNDAIEKYFSGSFRSLLISKKIEIATTKLEKLRKSLEMLDKNLIELKYRKEHIENLLKILNEVYVDIEVIHECVRNFVKHSAWKDITRCSNFIIDSKPDKGLYKISIKGLELELDVRKSFAENYFTLLKLLSDIDKSIKRALEEKGSIETRINELSNIIKDEIKKVELKLNRKIEWYEKFHWMISSEGFLIIGGKDASQNIKLIRRYLEQHDIVLHADIHGASVIVIKTNGKSVSEKTLKEAAVFAASYSKAWKLGLAAINVFWVYGSQISLKPPSGEYLPKGAFMVYDKKNYINNVELKLAIGVETVDVENGGKAIIRVLVGPEDVIRERTFAYIVLIPGDENPEGIAKMFLESIKKVFKDIIIAIDVRDLESRIPGRSKVIKLVIPK